MTFGPAARRFGGSDTSEGWDQTTQLVNRWGAIPCGNESHRSGLAKHFQAVENHHDFENNYELIRTQTHPIKPDFGYDKWKILPPTRRQTMRLTTRAA
jgi:hypothetical protein